MLGRNPIVVSAIASLILIGACERLASLDASELELESVKYDDAEWHYEADDFPSDLPESYGFTHIGFYLTWAAEHDLVSDFIRTESGRALTRVLDRRESPIFLLEYWDGKLVSDMLNSEGNAFSSQYYGGDSPLYFLDYDQTFPGVDGLYRVAPSWENYDRIEPVIDRRFQEWRENRSEND